MTEYYKETTVTVDGFKLYVYTSTYLPVKPMWHILLATLYIYWTYKDDIYISLFQSLKIVLYANKCKTVTKDFSRKNKEDKK